MVAAVEEWALAPSAGQHRHGDDAVFLGPLRDGDRPVLSQDLELRGRGEGEAQAPAAGLPERGWKPGTGGLDADHLRHHDSLSLASSPGLSMTSSYSLAWA